jgi:hypothetical protein
MGSNLTNKAIKTGLSISEAMDKFVSDLEVERAIAANSEYYTDTSGISASSAPLAPDEFSQSLEAGLKALNSMLQSGKVATLKIQLLVTKMRKVKLKAFGFPLHEKIYDQRVEVPEFLLHEKYINSHLSQIVGYDKKYVDVLIVRATKIPIAENIPANPKIGRPQIKDKIQFIIRMLDREAAINPASSVKAIGELIFESGKKKFPNDFIARDGKVKPGRSTIEKEYYKYKQSK